MKDQSEFFRCKALTEHTICDLIKALAEEFGRSIEVNVNVEVRSNPDIGGIYSSSHALEPQITTKVK